MMEEVPTSVLSDDPCHLGEGPTYDLSTDTAWWFDIREGRLFEAHLGSGSIRVHALGRMASGLGRIDAERQLIVAEDGLYIRTLADGALTLFCPLEADNPATRSNDARVHQSGTFWIGTMGRNAEAGAGAIYAFHRGKISMLFPRITIPNSICFSPDGATGYFADTARAVLYRRCRSIRRPACREASRTCCCATPVSAASTARCAMPTGRSGTPAGVRAGSMSTLRKASACARCACRRGSRAARPSSALICRASSSRRPGRIWTRRRAPPIRKPAALSCLQASARGRAEPDVKLA